MFFANCHLHSDFSDSFLSPETLAETAARLGHRAVVLTDHDTVRGLHRMDRAARRHGLRTLTGVEFIVTGLGTGFHLLGYDFDTEHSAMRELIARCAARHRERCHLLFEEARLAGTLRPGVTWQEVCDAFPRHDFLYYTQVFTVYLQKGIYRREEHPTFVEEAFSPPKSREPEIEAEIGFFTPDIAECISVIRRAGGVPVIAHPHARMAYIDDLIAMGLMGIEVHHPSVTPAEREQYTAICRARGLYLTGGTDHAGDLGGFADLFPKKNKPNDCGGADEADFLCLWHRTLG